MADTLRIRLARGRGRELSIEDPGGVFFQLVSRDPTPELGPQLMTSDSLHASVELLLPVASLQGLPYVSGADRVVPVFRESGGYRIRVGERLNTDDGTPVATCVVRFEGRR